MNWRRRQRRSPPRRLNLPARGRDAPLSQQNISSGHRERRHCGRRSTSRFGRKRGFDYLCRSPPQDFVRSLGAGGPSAGLDPLLPLMPPGCVTARQCGFNRSAATREFTVSATWRSLKWAGQVRGRLVLKVLLTFRRKLASSKPFQGGPTFASEGNADRDGATGGPGLEGVGRRR